MRVLLTGVSGVGKSTMLAALGDAGFPAVELDDAWCLPQSDGTRLWDLALVRRLLAGDATDLAVAGCEENMGDVLESFDHVVLLTAPADVVAARLSSREEGEFGALPCERERVLRDKAEIEPLLRDSCTVEIDSRGSVEVTYALLASALGLPVDPR